MRHGGGRGGGGAAQCRCFVCQRRFRSMRPMAHPWGERRARAPGCEKSKSIASPHHPAWRQRAVSHTCLNDGVLPIPREATLLNRPHRGWDWKSYGSRSHVSCRAHLHSCNASLCRAAPTKGLHCVFCKRSPPMRRLSLRGPRLR